MASSSHKELIIWDVQTLVPLAQRKWDKVNLGNILFHPNETLIAVDYENEKILTFNSNNLELIDYFSMEGARQICLNQDGAILCIAGIGWLKVLDLSTKESFDFKLKNQEFKADKFHIYFPLEICFNQQKQLFIAVFKEGEVIVVDISAGVVKSVISHLPNVSNTDFRNVTGLNQDLAQQLKQHGAIIDC